MLWLVTCRSVIAVHGCMVWAVNHGPVIQLGVGARSSNSLKQGHPVRSERCSSSHKGPFRHVNMYFAPACLKPTLALAAGKALCGHLKAS